MDIRINDLRALNQLSFYGKAHVIYDDNEGSSSLYSYGTFIIKLIDGSVVQFSEDENHYSRTTMKHLNDFLVQHGMDKTNLEEVRLSIQNGDWYDL